MREAVWNGKRDRERREGRRERWFFRRQINYLDVVAKIEREEGREYLGESDSGKEIPGRDVQGGGQFQ